MHFLANRVGPRSWIRTLSPEPKERVPSPSGDNYRSDNALAARGSIPFPHSGHRSAFAVEPRRS